MGMMAMRVMIIKRFIIIGFFIDFFSLLWDVLESFFERMILLLTVSEYSGFARNVYVSQANFIPIDFKPIKQ